MKVKTMFDNGRFQGVAFLIIVAKHAGHGRIQLSKYTDGFGLRDVTGMDHVIYVCCVKQFNNLSDVFQIIVGIADHANTHADILLV